MISFICGSRAEKQPSIIEEGYSDGASGKESTCNDIFRLCLFAFFDQCNPFQKHMTIHYKNHESIQML